MLIWFKRYVSLKSVLSNHSSFVKSAMPLPLFDIQDIFLLMFIFCTRSTLQGQRTVDLELEAQIEALRDTQRKYANILRLARALTSHFHNVVQTQRQLGDAFGELAQKSPELQEEFSYNAETQKVLSKNGETLLGKDIMQCIIIHICRICMTIL